MSIPVDKLKACVIDDDAMVRKLLTFILSNLGCEVSEYDNAIKVQESANALTHDIIFVDLLMPGMDGISYCKHHRQKEEKRGIKPIPIIGITGGDTGQEQGCSEAGMTDLIYKPFSRTHILNTVQKHTKYHWDESMLQDLDLTPIPKEEACFDQQVALESLDGNEEMLPTMITMFGQLKEALTADLDKAVAEEDTNLLQVTSHTLKTRSLYVGGARLNKLAKEIEMLCKQGDFENAVDRVPQLKIEVSDLMSALNNHN